ncbi:MAG: competence/damage-inducible protein A [Verrucomicrobiota bacterium]|nr:competence/damage-inducible protein A [Verrucomicrobiota bacterium]
MNIEIINTGTELMLGQVLNTHEYFLCRRLAEKGYIVSRQSAVADTPEAIESALRDAISRADVVICTGGLGPTSDDLTCQVVASLAGQSLIENASVVEHIKNWFASRNRPCPPGARNQALVPERAIVLPNSHGTAPGLIIEVPRVQGADVNSAWLVMLPGPPRELRPMFDDQVLPWLMRSFAQPAPFVSRTIRTTGIPESAMQSLLIGPLSDLVRAGLELGYCSRPGEVDVRLSARGENAALTVTEAEKIVIGLAGEHVYGNGDERLEDVVVRELARLGKTVVSAESCTGGRIANLLTDVPGASTVFLGGAVTYSNELKKLVLGVRAETLEAHGAVSEQTAREMAEGARGRFGADYALATTGIAGPSGGTPAKPVGTVFIALASERSTIVVHRLNQFDRDTFKQVTSQQALDMLRRRLRAV